MNWLCLCSAEGANPASRYSRRFFTTLARKPLKQTLDDPSLPGPSSIQLRASRITGMDAPKNTGKQAGLAALNLVFVLLILFGAQSLLRGHISKTAGLAILS